MELERRKTTKIFPNLIQLNNIFNDQGYELTPVIVKKGFKVSMWLKGEFLKTGSIVYTDWQIAQRETWKILYTALKQ